ncbi:MULTISPECIES: kelch repeat-containing protein [Sorangium]|uniref:kelch repeat-containing protein n=1 Tax=Sorangium TaxID=39643 RepID=UPI003D9C62CC
MEDGGDKLDAPREGHAAALLPSGKVLVAGGTNERTGGYFSSALLFDPVADTWTDAGSRTWSRAEAAGARASVDPARFQPAAGQGTLSPP